MNYRDEVIEDIVSFETNQLTDKEIKGLGYDPEHFKVEGNAWIVEYYDFLSEYYQLNKKRIDKEVKKILLSEAKAI